MLIAVEDATSTSRRPAAVQPCLVQDEHLARQACGLCICIPIRIRIRIGRSCAACSLLNRKTKIKYIISVELLVDCARVCVRLSVCVSGSGSGAYPVGNIIYRPCMEPVERC